MSCRLTPGHELKQSLVDKQIINPDNVIIDKSRVVSEVLNTNAKYQIATGESAPLSFTYLTEVLDTLEAKFNIPYTILNDPNSRYKGRVTFDSTPRVEINMAYATPDTPMHEYGHLLVGLLRQGNKQAYKSLLDEFDKRKDAQEIHEQTKINYPELSEAEQIEETMVELLGRLATDKLDPETGLYKFARKIWTTLKEFLEFAFNVNIDKDIEPNVSFDEMAILLADSSIKLNTNIKLSTNAQKPDVVKSGNSVEYNLYLHSGQNYEVNEKDRITDLKKTVNSYFIANDMIMYGDDLTDTWEAGTLSDTVYPLNQFSYDLTLKYPSFGNIKNYFDKADNRVSKETKKFVAKGFTQEMYDKYTEIVEKARSIIIGSMELYERAEDRDLTPYELSELARYENRLSEFDVLLNEYFNLTNNDSNETILGSKLEMFFKDLYNTLTGTQSESDLADAQTSFTRPSSPTYSEPSSQNYNSNFQMLPGDFDDYDTDFDDDSYDLDTDTYNYAPFSTSPETRLDFQSFSLVNLQTSYRFKKAVNRAGYREVLESVKVLIVNNIIFRVF